MTKGPIFLLVPQFNTFQSTFRYFLYIFQSLDFFRWTVLVLFNHRKSFRILKRMANGTCTSLEQCIILKLLLGVQA